jgi:endonuclease/exonuclease/phosphatase family metal-dependent hydrolase
LLAGQADDEARLHDATLLLRAARPDLLVLNECTLLAQDDGARFSQLEAALDMRGQLALAASGFHVALLLRAAQVEQVETLTEGFSHVALVASVRVCGLELRIAALHLDPYSAVKRAREVELICAQRPSLVLGDLNAISPRDLAAAHPEQWVERYRARHLDAAGAIDTRAIELLEQHGLVDVHAALHPQTTPTRPTARYARADRPAQRLDYIFASPELAGQARVCEPYDHAYAQTASDHLPLYADFE